MSSKGTPQKHSRWRVVVGDQPGPRRRRWPVAFYSAGLTEVPRRAGGRSGPTNNASVTHLMVVAQSTRWLRDLLDDPVSLAKVRRVRVVIDSWRNPHRSWSGRLGPLPGLLGHRIRMPTDDAGRVVIDIELRRPVPLRAMIVAVLPVLAPVRPVPVPASVDVTAQDVLPTWLGGQRNVAAIAGELPGNEDIRPHDVVLTTTGEPQPPVEPDLPGEARPTGAGELYGAVLAADATGAGAGVRTEIVMVDIEHTLPPRRYGPFGPVAPRARLSFTGAADGRGWQLIGPEGVLCAGRLDRPWLSEQAQLALAGIGIVSCPDVPARYPAAEAALLLHLVLAGALVHAPDLPPACQAYLTGEVRELLCGALPDEPGVELDWEVRAVAQRRAVMRGHASQFALPRLAVGAFPAIVELPSVTALLVTKRLEHVINAVTAIESQTYPNLEIVLCMHGIDLPAEARARVANCSRPVELLTLPSGHGFGEAIGVATGRARGSLVTKFDDDDTYGPEHVWDLVLARQRFNATIVGKGAEFVYLETLDTTVRRNAGAPETFAMVVAGGTMMISRGDLEEVGGWRPVPRSIDRGLIDRVHRAGGLIYRTQPLGYVYHRRSAGHTWDPGLEYFLRGGGTQWPGLPRHAEFGTTGPAVVGTGDERVGGRGGSVRAATIRPGRHDRDDSPLATRF